MATAALSWSTPSPRSHKDPKIHEKNYQPLGLGGDVWVRAAEGLQGIMEVTPEALSLILTKRHRWAALDCRCALRGPKNCESNQTTINYWQKRPTVIEWSCAARRA